MGGGGIAWPAAVRAGYHPSLAPTPSRSLTDLRSDAVVRVIAEANAVALLEVLGEQQG